MRHTPANISQVISLNRMLTFDPAAIPDGSAIVVHRRPTIDPLYLNAVAIRKITRSWGHHLAVKCTWNGEPTIIDSGAKGVLPYNVYEWVRLHYPKYFLVIPPIKEVDNEAWVKYLFRPYDYAGVYIHHPWYALTGQWIGKTGVEASEATYCTEVWTHEMGYAQAHKMTTADVIERNLHTIKLELDK